MNDAQPTEPRASVHLIITKEDTTMSKNIIKKTINTEATAPATEELELLQEITPEVTPKATAPAIHDSIDEVLEELKMNATIVEEPKATKAKAKKSKEPKETKEPKTLAYDLPAILAALPDEFTPSILDKAFALNDGGKTVRRHLRNHFAEAMTHNKKDKWTFAKADANEILTYFASRYSFHADAIATKTN